MTSNPLLFIHWQLTGMCGDFSSCQKETRKLSWYVYFRKSSFYKLTLNIWWSACRLLMSICLGSIALLLRALSQKVWLFGFLAPEAFSSKRFHLFYFLAVLVSRHNIQIQWRDSSKHEDMGVSLNENIDWIQSITKPLVYCSHHVSEAIPLTFFRGRNFFSSSGE